MLRVSLYDLEEDNALRTDPVNPFLQTQIGSKTSRGVEFQASHNVRDDLSLVAAFSYGTVKLSGQDYQAEGVPQYMARSEEHTSELQSLMRISYAVFCLKKKNNEHTRTTDLK